MKKDSQSPVQMRETKMITPLFQDAYKCTSSLADQIGQPSKYIAINSTEKMNEKIFKDAEGLCPVYVDRGRSYIAIEGDNLWDYFRAKK